MIPLQSVIMEIKVNERIAFWITELVAQRGLHLIRISKYCTALHAAGRVSNPYTGGEP